MRACNIKPIIANSQSDTGFQAILQWLEGVFFLTSSHILKLTNVELTDNKLGRGAYYASETEVRRSMKFFLSMERPATLFNTLKKNVISLAQCDTQTLSSSWEFISVKVKDCHWPNASDGVFT